jgi:hypothetical protein
MANTESELYKKIALFKQTELDAYKYIIELRKHCINQVLEKIYNGGDANIVVSMAETLEQYILKQEENVKTDFID